MSPWQERLSKGVLPRLGAEQWPPAVLQKSLLEVLSKLEMPRFCRRYPALLDALLKQILQVVQVVADSANCPPLIKQQQFSSQDKATQEKQLAPLEDCLSSPAG